MLLAAHTEAAAKAIENFCVHVNDCAQRFQSLSQGMR